MALLFTAKPSSLLLSLSQKSPLSQSPKPNSLSFPLLSKPHRTLRFSPILSLSGSQTDPTPEPDSDPKPTPFSSYQASTSDEWGEKSELDPTPEPEPDSDPKPTPLSSSKASISDEWGEESELGSELEPSKLPDSDPPRNEDEWEEQYVEMGNGTPAAAHEAAGEKEEGFDSRIADLKRCLVDTVYGTDLGFRAGAEVRAEVLELVNQLEAVNPTQAPVEATQLLDGNWVLL